MKKIRKTGRRSVSASESRINLDLCLLRSFRASKPVHEAIRYDVTKAFLMLMACWLVLVAASRWRTTSIGRSTPRTSRSTSSSTRTETASAKAPAPPPAHSGMTSCPNLGTTQVSKQRKNTKSIEIYFVHKKIYTSKNVTVSVYISKMSLSWRCTKGMWNLTFDLCKDLPSEVVLCLILSPARVRTAKSRAAPGNKRQGLSKARSREVESYVRNPRGSLRNPSTRSRNRR